MIVMKFGGTSNRDAAAIRNVIEIVSGRVAEHPILVISAIAQATNDLETVARKSASGDTAGARRVLESLLSRHAVIVEQLLTGAAERQRLLGVFADYRRRLDELVTGVSILGELTLRTMDAFCAYGERFSSRLVAAGLKEAGVNAVWVDASEVMITDDAYGHAQPRMDLVAERLQKVVRPLIEQGAIPVTQGFIGSTEQGIPTTMGRESSDYSASIIGAAMHADSVEIWTDVDGILTADPSVVSNPTLNSGMTFEEAFELSYFGAKVLHPNTMLPVIEEGIPVRIRNAGNRTCEGTLVSAESANHPGPAEVKSIAFQRGLAVIAVRPHRRLGQYLFWESVFSVLTGANISCSATATSEYGIAFAVPENGDLSPIASRLETFGAVRMLRHQASICLVGQGLHSGSENTGRVFGALHGIDVAMVSLGASELSLIVLVDDARVHEAVNRLHKTFFDHSVDKKESDGAGAS